MKITVKDMSTIAGVSIKTLYHYHKIGLLLPSEVNESGYRYYGMAELKRLQEILFYKELDIPLLEIKQLLDEDSNRVATLKKQEELFAWKIERYQQLIHTIKNSIDYTRKGENMDNKLMFKGLDTEDEWKNALEEQITHLKDAYNVDLNLDDIDVDKMNVMAIESQNFTDTMAAFLRTGVKYNDSRVKEVARKHLKFLNKNGNVTNKEDFINQTTFFLQDDFHRDILEKQQTGLVYYLFVVAENL
ncbi:MerR family transcriptional regulator [Virgibacillus ndiopensis]|uniref:MerR family transcriptional regulator n=1 Tax=Virgibacillus ndiopensis TaxID=2004408 RepID=UPI000C07DB89|nr:MerR family transcriptional regulator [Virgibacillus ndiopensis]